MITALLSPSLVLENEEGVLEDKNLSTNREFGDENKDKGWIRCMIEQEMQIRSLEYRQLTVIMSLFPGLDRLLLP